MACLYLASKVDEFNVSIDEFVQNLKSGTKSSNTEIILGLEADLMRLLRFHLTVHGPYRPFEGHMIEIKVLENISEKQIFVCLERCLTF